MPLFLRIGEEMKKIYIAVFIALMLLNASCTSTERNKNLINYYDNNTESPFPNYRNHPESRYLSKNQSLINYMRYNNIDEYNYTVSGNTLRIWINNFENMTEDQKTSINNALIRLYGSVEFINDEKDLK